MTLICVIKMQVFPSLYIFLCCIHPSPDERASYLPHLIRVMIKEALFGLDIEILAALALKLIKLRHYHSRY